MPHQGNAPAPGGGLSIKATCPGTGTAWEKQLGCSNDLLAELLSALAMAVWNFIAQADPTAMVISELAQLSGHHIGSQLYGLVIEAVGPTGIFASVDLETDLTNAWAIFGITGLFTVVTGILIVRLANVSPAYVDPFGVGFMQPDLAIAVGILFSLGGRALRVFALGGV